MPSYLVNAAVKAEGLEDWTYSKVIHDVDGPGEAIEATEDDEDFDPPADMQNNKDKVWYFKMEIVKQR